MTNATSSRNPAWQAEVKWETRYYTTDEQIRKGDIEETPDGELVEATEDKIVEVPHHVRECFVHLWRPGCERIRFRVNDRGGHGITFSDPRDRGTGIAGVTGIWGTLPAPPVDKPRPLTPTAFRVEVERLIGLQRAEEIVATARSEIFLHSSMTFVGDKASRRRVRTSSSTTRTAP